jgi:hypothetical protein
MDEQVTCVVCAEPDDGDDVVAHFWDATAGEQRMAHAQCGEDQGWRLA